MSKLETRTFPFEVRIEGTAEEPTLVGYAIKWGERSEPLPFFERFLPGAFTKSLEAGRDVLALVGHELSKVLGRRSNGTLELAEDEVGLRVVIRPNMNTSYAKDAVAAVRRRDVAGMSVGFIPVEDRLVSDGEGERVREIVEADLREVSIASLPAYAGTSVSAREEMVAVEEREKQEQAVATEEPAANEKAGEERQEAPPEERQQERATPRVDVRLATPTAETRSAAFADYLRGRPFDTRQMTLSPQTAGGYLAPETFVAELIKALKEASVMRQVARVVGPIAAASVRFPRLDETVSAAWTPEAQAVTPSDPTFEQVEFTPHKLAALTRVSGELLGDSAISVESLLASLFGEEFARVEDEAFFNGSGSGQPSGIVNDANIPTVSAAAGTTIEADDILSLYDSLPPQYRPNAVWVLHPSTMSVLRQLKDQNGQYLLVAGLAASAPTTLLGRPVFLTSHMPEIGASAKTILFGDLRRTYFIVDRQGIDVQRSGDRYFEQDLVAFRAIKRTDGKVVLPDAARFLQQAAA